MTRGVPEEIELKLELSAETADDLEACGLLPGEPVVIRQEARYFDTPERDLAAVGLSLRIRRNGEALVQTVKARKAAAGLFVRSEWEFPVADHTPVLDESTPIRALIGKRADRIGPLFTIENERRLWNMGGIEVALDRGCARADGPQGGREDQFCEVELEAKGCHVAQLFALARRIDGVAPVQLGVVSKGERGYRLLEPRHGAERAAPLRLSERMRSGEALQAIVTACLAHYRLNVPRVLEREDAAALHQARVALRRLRSALAVFEPLAHDPVSRRLDADLRWLAHELAPARDLDVLAARCGEGPLQTRLRAARGDFYRQAREAMTSHRARTLMLDLAEWLAAGDWLTTPATKAARRQPARDFAEDALDHLRRKVKRSGRDLATRDDEARHRVRKAAKKLRYAAEFFAALFDEGKARRRHERFVAALESLQDRLGTLNDLATTRALLETLDLAHTPEAAPLLDAGTKARQLEKAVEAYEAFVDARRFW